MEIDQEKSTFELIVFKQIKNKYPQKVSDIKCRNWYITNTGKVTETSLCQDICNLSTESRAKAFLALMQLVELRDAWNKIDNFVPDFSNIITKYCISVRGNEITKSAYLSENITLCFGFMETRDLFLTTFKDLIQDAKELI